MSEVSLTRQPIFDRHKNVAGYDVRFRPSVAGGDPLAQWLFTGSLQTLSRGKPVWVQVSESLLLREALLSRTEDARLVAVIAAATEPAAALLQKLAALPAAGISVALDEFQAPSDAADPLHRLMAHASFVRIDAGLLSSTAFAAACAAAKRAGLVVVADHVGDEQELTGSDRAGAELFQGAHFSHPQPLPKNALPASTINALQVLSLARDDATPERDLERAISGDPTLTYQLLRVVNSASIGGRGISSVSHALRLAGRATLVRWLALAVFASRADQSPLDRELSDQAVRRAFMANYIAERCVECDPQPSFLTGMFSMIDAVFRVPLVDVLDRINVVGDVRDALLHRTGLLARILDYIEAFELGQWEYAASLAQELGVEPDEAARAYGYADGELIALLAAV